MKSLVVNGVWSKSSFFLLDIKSVSSLFTVVTFHFPEGEINTELQLSNIFEWVLSLVSLAKIKLKILKIYLIFFLILNIFQHIHYNINIQKYNLSNSNIMI